MRYLVYSIGGTIVLFTGFANEPYLKLFNYLDVERRVYTDLKGNQEGGSFGAELLYTKAKDGDAESAFKLVTMRRENEYEQYHEVDELNVL